jgi:hypothetical protein
MDDGQARANDVLAKIVERGIRQGRARKTELDDRNVCRAVAHHERWRDARRHVLQDDERAAGYLRDGLADIGSLVEKDLLDADPLIARRLDARDVIDKRGKLALVNGQDPVLNVLRPHAVVGPDDADDGDVDFRENIDRHALGGANTQQTNEDQYRGNRVGPPEHQSDNGHNADLLPIGGRER